MQIVFVVAYAKNRVIGRENAIPWHLPDDLRFFKRTTLGHPVLMGRKTFESIGKPLPKRENLILTRQDDFEQVGIRVFREVEDALQAAKASGAEACHVIGGGQIYAHLLNRADRVIATEVQADVPGEVFFPELATDSWREISREHHPADDRHFAPFDFVVYQRIR